MAPAIPPGGEEAAKEAAKLLPEVYKDALQPATREVGTVLGRAVHAALGPVRGLVWSIEQAETWLERAVAERLAARGVAESAIVSPRPQILAGVLRGLQSAGPESDPTLRDLFANLLAAAVDGERTSTVHPAYAEILCQVSPQEAKMLDALGARIQMAAPYGAEGGRGLLLNLRTTWAPPGPQPRVVKHWINPAAGRFVSHPLLDASLDNLRRLGLVDVRWFGADPASEWVAELRPESDMASASNAMKILVEWAWENYAIGPSDSSAVGSEMVGAYLSPPAGGPFGPQFEVSVLFPTSFGRQLLRAVAP